MKDPNQSGFQYNNITPTNPLNIVQKDIYNNILAHGQILYGTNFLGGVACDNSDTFTYSFSNNEFNNLSYIRLLFAAASLPIVLVGTC